MHAATEALAQSAGHDGQLAGAAHDVDAGDLGQMGAVAWSPRRFMSGTMASMVRSTSGAQAS